MAENKRSAIKIEDDRRRIADLYLKGMTQAAIAQEIGVSQPQISYDLGVIRQQWRASTTINLDEAKLKELSRIDLLERTYWEAWQRSLDERVKTRTERYTGDDGKGKASVEKETLLGVPAYLAGVQWCISERCRVLGLYAPQRQELTGKDGEPIKHEDVGLTDTERIAKLTALLNSARARRDRPAADDGSGDVAATAGAAE